jgi:hypothetical protein
MKKELCIDTVKQLGKFKGAILHSDRGSQYTSDASCTGYRHTE